MSQVLELKYPATGDEPEISHRTNPFPETHEDDMGETTIHYKLISYLFNALDLFFEQHADVFIAANLNFYYDPDDPKKYYVPDIIIAFGISNHDRKTYKLWEEKLFPQVIFEVASESTWKKDISDKVEDYERLGAEEYSRSRKSVSPASSDGLPARRNRTFAARDDGKPSRFITASSSGNRLDRRQIQTF
jgi:hypothetical protein